MKKAVWMILLVCLTLAVSVSALAERTGSGTETDPWLISEASDFSDYTASTISGRSGWYDLESGSY